MSLQTGFTFDGQHCMTHFGCVYVEQNAGRTITPAITANEYQIGGTSGTVRFDGQVYAPIERKGALYPLTRPVSDASAQQKARALSAWLANGRKQLIFDYETSKYYMAEMLTGSIWTAAQWMDGGLEIAMLCQPFAYSVSQSSASVGMGTSGSMTLSVSTGVEAPVSFRVTNTGSAPIASVTLTVGSKRVVLSGMNMAAGSVLNISMEPPIGAVIGNASAMQYASSFDYITLTTSATIGVAITYGAGTTKTATVQAFLRGRWI